MRAQHVLSYHLIYEYHKLYRAYIPLKFLFYQIGPHLWMLGRKMWTYDGFQKKSKKILFIRFFTIPPLTFPLFSLLSHLSSSFFPSFFIAPKAYFLSFGSRRWRGKIFWKIYIPEFLFAQSCFPANFSPYWLFNTFFIKKLTYQTLINKYMYSLNRGCIRGCCSCSQGGTRDSYGTYRTPL